MSEESIGDIVKSDSNLMPTFVDNHLLPDMNFNGHCLIKINISIPKKVINLYISYTLGPQLRNLDTGFTLGNCLFGSVKLHKNAGVDKYKYTGNQRGFDSRAQFSFTGGSYGNNVIIFGADMRSSVHVDNRTSNYLNPVCKFVKFPFNEPIKWKTPSPAKLLIECNSGRNK